ncbi:hypothetical protein V2A60_010197 [Cordyceps javanica]
MQDPRSHLRTRDHSHSRRSTMDSTTRPPVIVTTVQNDRAHKNAAHSAVVRNGSPVRDEYRHTNSQHYTLPASTNRSRSSARPYRGEDYTRRRDRGDSLLSPLSVESYRQSRPSVTYPSNPRHSATSIDYGDDGYKYTNAGELVRYDLDHSKPSRSPRHDSFDRGYYHPRTSYASNHRRSDGPRHDVDRGYAVPHERSDARGGPPPTMRGFDKTLRDYAVDQDRQALPAAPKPPKPLPYSETSGNFRDPGETRHRRPVSVSQEPSYWDNSHHIRDDFRDRRGHVRDRSDDRMTESKRPHSTHFYDDSGPSRAFGIRTSPDTVPDARRDNRHDGRRNREDARGGGFLQHGEKSLPEARQSTHDRAFPLSAESKRPEGDGKERDREAAYNILGAAGTGLGISAAAAGFAASRRDNEPANGPDEQSDATHGPAIGNLGRHETFEAAERSSPKDRHSPRPEPARAGEGDSAGLSDNGGASLVKYSNSSASDSDDAGRSKVRGKQRLPGSFNPRDTDDLRQIKEQLAALRMQDNQQQSNEPVADQVDRSARPTSPNKEVSPAPASDKGEESLAVGFPADKKHARVVSPPRDKREEKPLRGILKQPSASFPEEANPVREGVAPHKEDKKLKEVPPGARWTKINRKVVNPEALTIGQERFEERDGFVIVLRVLSKEEIQAYAAATQILRERRRDREDPDREQERRRHDDDDSPRHHRRNRRHGGGDGHDNDADGKTRGLAIITSGHLTLQEHSRSDGGRGSSLE